MVTESFGKKISEAQLEGGDAKKYPEFKANVKAVATRENPFQELNWKQFGKPKKD